MHVYVSAFRLCRTNRLTQRTQKRRGSSPCRSEESGCLDTPRLSSRSVSLLDRSKARREVSLYVHWTWRPKAWDIQGGTHLRNTPCVDRESLRQKSHRSVPFYAAYLLDSFQCGRTARLPEPKHRHRLIWLAALQARNQKRWRRNGEENFAAFLKGKCAMGANYTALSASDHALASRFLTLLK